MANAVTLRIFQHQIILRLQSLLDIKSVSYTHLDVYKRQALYALKTAKTAGFPTVGVKDPSSAGQEREIIKQADYYLYTFTK